MTAVDTKRMEAALLERDGRLALIDEITKKIKRGETVDAIIRATVEGVAPFFPTFDTTYATVDRLGLTVICTASADGTADSTERRFPTSLSDEYLERLLDRAPIAVDDVALDTTAGPLADTLSAANRRAYLSAPLQYADGQIGLLAIHSQVPHSWTEHEKATVLNAADVLALAIDDATRRQQLRESEEKFRLLAENSDINISIVQGTTVTYANPAMERMTGYSKAELREMDFQTLVAPEYRDIAREWATLRFQGEPLHAPLELKIIAKDGRERWIEFRGCTIELGGEPTLLSSGVETTQQKQAEELLLESESRLRDVLDQLGEGVCVVADGKMVYVNPGLCRMFGYNASELLEAAPIQFPAASEPNLDAHRKDGTPISVEVTTRPISYGGAPALLITVGDLTERKERDQAVRASEQRFRTLFEQAPIGIVIVKADTTFVRVNAAFCEMLGYTEAELIGKSFVELTHEGDLGGTPESAERVLEDAKSVVRFNKRYVRKDGAIVEAETTVSLVRDATGDPLYALAMIEDVTERHQLESQLEQVQRLESVGQLAAGVAHNFNNSLTAIYGYSELLSRRFDPNDPALKDLEQIKLVAEKSAKLTRQLLAFSRKEQVQLSVFRLNDVVEGSRDILAPILLGDHVEVVLRLDGSLGCIRSDRGQMEQVVTNLMLNARDAMPSGGTLTAETRRTTVDDAFVRANPGARAGTYINLTVTDTGFGMESETVSRVFEPFFTTKEEGKGVGLGLAMVHGAITQSGGFVTVTSTVGVGSSFAVYLPEHADAEAQPGDTTVDTPAAL